MNPGTTHIQVAPGDGAIVTVTPTDDGRWFQVLHWYITSGAAARLYRAHKAAPLLMDVLGHLRERTSGLSTAPLETLRPLLGLSDSTIYEAKTAILRSNDGLALEPTPWVFRLFPGRSFAGRSVHASAPPNSGNADPIPETRNPFRERGISPSHSPSAQFQREKHDDDARPREAAAVREQGERDRVVVALLEREGFAADDARRLVAAGGPGRVRTVIANADHLAKAGRLKNRRGYIAKGIREGWSLFDKVEQRAVRALKDKLDPLRQAGRWPLTPEQTQRIGAQYGGAEGLVRAGVVSTQEIDAMDAMELVGVIAARVEGGVKA